MSETSSLGKASNIDDRTHEAGGNNQVDTGDRKQPAQLLLEMWPGSDERSDHALKVCDKCVDPIDLIQERCDDLAAGYLRGGRPLYETTDPVEQVRRQVGNKWIADDAPSGATIFNGRRNEITLNKAFASSEGFTFIHELLHAAGARPFSHREIVDAIHRLEGRTDMGENNFIGKYCQERKSGE